VSARSGAVTIVAAVTTAAPATQNGQNNGNGGCRGRRNPDRGPAFPQAGALPGAGGGSARPAPPSHNGGRQSRGQSVDIPDSLPPLGSETTHAPGGRWHRQGQQLSLADHGSRPYRRRENCAGTRSNMTPSRSPPARPAEGDLGEARTAAASARTFAATETRHGAEPRYRAATN